MANSMLPLAIPTTGWESNLATLPRLTEEQMQLFYTSRSGSERSLDRSYNFSVESYLIPSSVQTNSSNQSNGLVFIKAACYRSKKKSCPPYTTIAAIDNQGDIVHGTCECPAGKLACNHLMAMLRTVQWLQVKGFSEAPDHISCTDLPQQWRVPRRSTIQGGSVQAVDWRSVREGGVSLPKLARPKERRWHPRNEEQQDAAKQQLATRLLALSPTNKFAKALLATGQPFKKTKYGLAPASSPLAYQQPLQPHGFTSYVAGISSAELGDPQLIPAPEFFAGCSAWAPPAHLETNSILEEVRTTPEASLVLEKNTRQQARSATWKRQRSHRLTASNFGVVLSRKNWTSKGLHGITSCKDLSRVPAIRYGIANEAMAAKRYEDVMRSMGHDVTTSSCGLLVNPEFPWLGASPDRIVFDPVESTHGVLEIKCPYSLRYVKGSELAAHSFCSKLTATGPVLKREHSYYSQIIGQMAIPGLSWGDFVVYSKDFILVERIRFDPKEWEGMKEMLDSFYFDVLMPFLESNSQN